jgi:hypothetical protein
VAALPEEIVFAVDDAVLDKTLVGQVRLAFLASQALGMKALIHHFEDELVGNDFVARRAFHEVSLKWAITVHDFAGAEHQEESFDIT